MCLGLSGCCLVVSPFLFGVVNGFQVAIIERLQGGCQRDRRGLVSLDAPKLRTGHPPLSGLFKPYKTLSPLGFRV